MESISRVLISHFQATEPLAGETFESVIRGTFNTIPTVTFIDIQHHRPLSGTKLYCLATEVHVCEQLAQGCYSQESNI